MTRTTRRLVPACLCLLGLLLVSGCGPMQAYPGPSLPSYETAILEINPPQANIGFQLVAVNDRPVNAGVSVAVLPGSNTLSLQVWPTSSITFQESDPAFAEHFQRIDQKYQRTMTIEFTAVAGRSYGLSGQFDQGPTPAASSFSINVFDVETREVLARSDTDNTATEADRDVEALKDTDREEWSVGAGPAS